MAKPPKPTPQTIPALQRAAGLAIVYIGLIFLLPPSQATMQAYNLSPLGYKAIYFAAALPIIVAWIAAFVGYAKLKDYVQMVRRTPEGPHFSKLATGCAWLAWSLPLPAIAGLLLNTLGNQRPSFYPASIIIGNYLNLLMPLVAFTIISNTSRSLVTQAKLRFSLSSARLIMLLFLAAGVLYCYLTFQRFDLNSLGSTSNPYFLPIWLMVLTVIIPCLYTWFIGLLAAYEITLFSQQTDGVLYRQALRYLALGLVVIIASSIAVQYLKGIQPRTGHLVLGYQVILSSVFRLVGGGGFILLAIGASRLKKIEEV